MSDFFNGQLIRKQSLVAEEGDLLHIDTYMLSIESVQIFHGAMTLTLKNIFTLEI